MSYIDHQLMPNEKILMDSELHWVIFLWPFVATIVCVIFMFRQHYLFILNYAAVILIVYFLGDVFIRYVTTSYALTNLRTIIKRGFFMTRTWDIALSRIESVQVQQSLLGRMFGYGDVRVNGTGGDSLVFNCIEDPTLFRQKILEAMEGDRG